METSPYILLPLSLYHKLYASCSQLLTVQERILIPMICSFLVKNWFRPNAPVNGKTALVLGRHIFTIRQLNFPPNWGLSLHKLELLNFVSFKSWIALPESISPALHLSDHEGRAAFLRLL